MLSRRNRAWARASTGLVIVLASAAPVALLALAAPSALARPGHPSGIGDALPWDSVTWTGGGSVPTPRNTASTDNLANGATTRVSVSSEGEGGNLGSLWPSMTGDGRLVAFHSPATNLVPTDRNRILYDVFVHNQVTGETALASLGWNGKQCDCQSGNPALSTDGRYLAFANLDCRFFGCAGAHGSPLVPDDTNHAYDVFVRDLEGGTIQRVSVSSYGEQGNGNSGGGSMIGISADARYVTFVSSASNLVPDDTNGQPDVFLHDRLEGTTERVNVSSEGQQANGLTEGGSISADGRYVVFWSKASNLVQHDHNGDDPDNFIHDRKTGKTQIVEPEDDYALGATISGNGRYVIFSSSDSDLVSSDTNNRADVFVHDLWTGTNERASVDSRGREGKACDDIGWWGCGAWDAAISTDGRYVTFESEFRDLVGGDTNRMPDVFWHDRRTGVTLRISASSAGDQGNDRSGWFTPSPISDDGRQMVFDSYASNLVPRDTNRIVDVFAHHLRAPAP